MRLPFIQFFPADYATDTRALSLATKGGWVDILCALHTSSTRGAMTLPVVGWARTMGATVDQAAAVISELDAMKVADVKRDGNGDVTISSRRMLRELITREQTRLRVERHRRKSECNAESESANGNVTGKKTEDRRQKTETIQQKDAPLIIPMVLNVPEFLGPWSQWEAIRRRGKKPKSPWNTYFSKQLAWLEPFGLQPAIEVVSYSARNEYQGLFHPRGGAASAARVSIGKRSSMA